MTNPSVPPAVDVLGSPEPVRRSSRLGGLAVGLVGASAIAVAGSAVAFAAYLGGGGAQPEDVLPGDALGLVKLDLDPAAGQKVAVYRLAERFPATADEVADEESVKDQLLGALFADSEDVDYAEDLQPWIGDRVGAAFVPGDDEPEPLLAIAYTDRDEAERALERGVLDMAEEAFFAFSEKADYVLVGMSQEVVDQAAKGEDVLADSASWEKGMDALDGDQIVTVWADLDAVYDALPQEARDEAAEAYGLETDVALGGTFVAGVRAGDDHVEVVGRALDLESPFEVASPIGGGKGSGLVRGLPEDTVGALSVTDLGAGLAEVFGTAYGDDDPLGLVASARELGLELPDDLPVLLGEETVVGVFGEQDVAVRARTQDSQAAYDKAVAIVGSLGGADPASLLRRLDDGLAAGTTPEALEAISAVDGGLGDTDAFRLAVPDAQGAGYLLYVDIARALEVAGVDLGEQAADVEVLQSFGMTGTGDATSSTFRLRLTVKD